MRKQYIQWLDDRDEAWKLAIKLGKTVMNHRANQYVLVSVERYQGAWRVVTVPRNQPDESE